MDSRETGFDYGSCEIYFCKSLGQNSPLFVIGVVLKEVGILVNGDKYIYIRYGQCERQVSAKTTYKQDTAVRKKGRFIYHSLVGWVCQKDPFVNF